MAHREGCMEGRCGHTSDCAVHNEPAMPRGLCDCGHREAQRVEHDRRARRRIRWVRVYNWFVCHSVVTAELVVLVLLATAATVFAIATTMAVTVHNSGG